MSAVGVAAATGWRDGELLPTAEAPVWDAADAVTVAGCREVFDAVTPFTIGLEEELMLVDPGSFELAPVGSEVVALFPPGAPYRTELRAAQLEIVTPVSSTAAQASDALAGGRRTLVERLDGGVRLVASGTHPSSTEDDWGTISEGERYRLVADEYPWAARRTLSCGLHVHVAVGGADRTLAVYNALRSYLPSVVALASNSPYVDGCDTGLCSMRMKLQEAFVRAGVPPAFGAWEDYVDFVRWGRAGGAFPDATHLWWGLRLHPSYGTLEMRVADAQTRVEDAAAIAAFVRTLVVWLARRHDEGEALRVDDHFRLHENCWRATRHGVAGWLVDCRTGEPVPTRAHLARLLERLEPLAAELGELDDLHAVRTLLAGNGAERQRAVGGPAGLHRLNRWLTDETEAALG